MRWHRELASHAQHQRAVPGPKFQYAPWRMRQPSQGAQQDASRSHEPMQPAQVGPRPNRMSVRRIEAIELFRLYPAVGLHVSLLNRQ
jgi:hypothetical protein